MKLLDRIAQAPAPLLVARDAASVRLPGAADFAAAIAACPLRLVLADPLTRLCASLAYADGDRLGRCLDLVHIPATRLWVEWLDRPHLESVAAALSLPTGAIPETAMRAGVYLTTDAAGRRGTARTFWGPTDGDDEPCLAPLVTEFDLDADDEAPGPIVDVFNGATVALRSDDPAFADLLRCLRFRFDAQWAAYYRAECTTPALREDVLRASLATVGTDLPVVFALCLLMSSHTRLPERRADLSRLNRRRTREGRAALLDHVEVNAPVMSAYSVDSRGTGESRRMPRLHHVRGHLVRRGSQVFWRVPHLRGRAAFGNMRARSVTLQFEPRGAPPHAGWPGECRPVAAHPRNASPSLGGPP